MANTTAQRGNRGAPGIHTTGLPRRAKVSLIFSSAVEDVCCTKDVDGPSGSVRASSPTPVWPPGAVARAYRSLQ
jgi:hypothetical protein